MSYEDDAYDRWRDQDLMDNGFGSGRRRWGKRPIGDVGDGNEAQRNADASWDRARTAMDRHSAVGGTPE